MQLFLCYIFHLWNFRRGYICICEFCLCEFILNSFTSFFFLVQHFCSRLLVEWFLYFILFYFSVSGWMILFLLIYFISLINLFYIPLFGVPSLTWQSLEMVEAIMLKLSYYYCDEKVTLVGTLRANKFSISCCFYNVPDIRSHHCTWKFCISGFLPSPSWFVWKDQPLKF